MKKNESGFSLFELMVVIAIIAIISTIAIPNFISWRANAYYRGAVYNLKSDLEMAKLRAIRSGANVVVDFSAESGSVYDIFLDTNNDYKRDISPSSDEPLISSTTLRGIALVENFGGNEDSTAFNNLGHALRPGKIFLIAGDAHSADGFKSMRIEISRIGLITIESR